MTFRHARFSALLLILAASPGCVRTPDVCGVRAFLGQDVKAFMEARNLKVDQVVPEGDGTTFVFHAPYVSQQAVPQTGAVTLANPTPQVAPVNLNPRANGPGPAPASLPQGDRVAWVPAFQELILKVYTDATGRIKSYEYRKVH